MLYGENLGSKLLSTISNRAFDLIRIAAYAYAADQEISRGGERDVYGRDWRRQITLCVPVTEPTFWSSADVSDALCTALNFATDDQWRFAFDLTPVGRDRMSLFQGDDEAVIL